ncbi:MAG: TlyA family RNA methyltransferase [Defluviitaleaceae bacterium]|nr:TlyA family RNA methyltransferase [Defluviitaleaceae bacterium]
MDAKRLDVLVAEVAGVSREQAKELVLLGECLVDGKVITKPGMKVDEGVKVVVDAKALPYVSRGGLKLAKGLEVFRVDLQGLKCMDIGASTGGFTDCMLQNGASAVLAIDNGSDQIHEKLRDDPRVIVWEDADIRKVERESLPFLADFVAVDVSFISLTLILPSVYGVLKDEGCGILLIKPQFEAGPKAVNKKGIAKNPKDHEKAIKGVCDKCVEIGLRPLNIDFSPIKGKGGNVEYLLFVQKGDGVAIVSQRQISSVVKEATEREA